MSNRFREARVSFWRTVRGVEVRVFADSFNYEPDAGIELGPEEVWAETADGAPFELTDAEAEQFGAEATEAYLSDEDYHR